MKRIIYITLFATFSFFSLPAQVWNTVGMGFQGNLFKGSTGMKSVTYNNEIYVAYNEFITTNLFKPAHVKRWDGLCWHSYPTIPDYHITDLVVDGNSIYVTGYPQASTNNIAFYEFDGNNWIARAPSGFLGRSYTAELISGDLMVGGAFTDGAAIDKFLMWDGTSFISFPSVGPSISAIEDIIEFNGEMHISCSTFTSTQLDGLYKWDGTSWVMPATKYQGISGPPYLNRFFKMFIYQNELYLPQFWELFKLGNDTLHHVTSLVNGVISVAEYNGQMFIGDSIRLNTFDGTTISPILNSPSAYGLNVLNNELYAFSITNHSFNGIPYNHAHRTQSSFALLQGQVYLDANNDCFKNQTEEPLRNVIVGLNNQSITVTDTNGFYSISAAPGTFSLNLSYVPTPVAKNLTLSCSLPSSFTLGANQSLVLNIPLSNPVANDMAITMNAFGGWRARYGFNEWNKLQVINAGNSTQASASLKVELPPSFNFVSSTPPPSSQTANNLIYNFINIEPYDIESILIEVEVDTAQNSLGDTVEWRAYFSPIITVDADTLDNSKILFQEIVGAYDPNDKQASDETIEVGTTSIDYHINFQNTGNDTAYKVTVVDTLDMSIPLSSVVINSTSHPYRLSVVNNVLIWEFDSILLPDSTTNYLGSMGYANFSVNLSPNLNVGDTVKNQAYIFFDYQHPIKTNLAKTSFISHFSIVDQPLKHELKIFPNPANNFIIIEHLENETIPLQLLDISGRLISKFQIHPKQRMKYPVNNLDPGTYVLKSTKSSYLLVVQ